MIDKNTLRNLFNNKSKDFGDIISEALIDKAETVVANIVEDVSQEILSEMTPGHKEMMAQHLNNLTVVDNTPDEKDGKSKVKPYTDSRIKNPKRPDNRDDYNELGDFKASKADKPKFVTDTNKGKKPYYTTNQRELRSET